MVGLLVILKKIISFLKNYWYIPVIFILIIVVWFITAGKTTDALVNIINNARDTHRKEINKLDTIHKEEIKKREKALETYHKTVQDVEKKYLEENKKLTIKKKKQIKKIVEETNGDSEALANKLSERLGFDVVHPLE